MKMWLLVFVVVLGVVVVAANYGYSSPLDAVASGGTFNKLCNMAINKDGVKEIDYRQFMMLRQSGEKYVLLDVLSADSYKSGHLPSARSFPVGTINKDSAQAKLAKDDNIVVYCGGPQCMASTMAAKKLIGLGYKVLDYKGGLEDWTSKGNKLEK